MPVVLVGLKGIIGDIVRDVLDEGGVSVVADLVHPDELNGTLTRTGAECVIWCMENVGASDRGQELLVSHPLVKILALEEDGTRGFVWELQPRRVPLGEMSPSLLIHAVQAVAPR